jgi:DNA-binding MarR family transcriptional regulator
VSSPTDSRVAADLGDAISRLNSRLRRDIVESGVSLARARTLATLDRQGPRRLTDLALAEQVAQPTMSDLVARLEADGLVKRAGDEADGRTVVVSITAAGRRCLARLIDRRAESIERTLSDLPAEDRAAVAAALPALGRLLKKMEERNAVGAIA